MLKKRLMGIILAIVMASASTGNFYSKAESDENEEIVRLEKSTGNETDSSKINDRNYVNLDDIEMVPEIEDLSRKEQRAVNEAVEVADKSGEEAGEILNKLADKSDAVEVGVKEVLDTYFSADIVDVENVEEFNDTLNIDIEERTEEYKTAREERDNDENLDYVTGEELVIFDKKYIKGRNRCNSKQYFRFL